MATAEQERTLMDMKIKMVKDKPQNLLVLCGPPCSGKTMLIEHFIFSNPSIFQFIPPFTTKTKFEREEIENVHYRLASQNDFTAWQKEDKLLYLTQEQMINTAVQTNYNYGSGVQANAIWNGVLFEEASRLRNEFKIGIIETSLDGAKQIYAKQRLPCNFIYVHPPTTDELAVRLIRNRPGKDTQHSMTLKQNNE
ncbi:guanylate kinase [Stylonychia lemnae]|uniref:Guanylate kinase n=1 Tax=Stylonychia lemnae TaxID=5949 RepID=A0A078ATZ9_STYLE|nr:guanylate kinase [Stylonychia lemnae]|eukprot:CDW84318.1 guanylate kinase [Stylonychia lemnae]